MVGVGLRDDFNRAPTAGSINSFLAGIIKQVVHITNNGNARNHFTGKIVNQNFRRLATADLPPFNWPLGQAFLCFLLGAKARKSGYGLPKFTSRAHLGPDLPESGPPCFAQSNTREDCNCLGRRSGVASSRVSRAVRGCRFRETNPLRPTSRDTNHRGTPPAEKLLCSSLKNHSGTILHPMRCKCRFFWGR